MEAKDRVILKSIELFQQAGIRLVTMDQIAGEVGMSKRTIYEMFKDKDDLLMQCLDIMNLQTRTEIQEIISKSANAIEALYLIGQHGEKRKASINKLFFEDFKKLYPQIWKNLREKNGPGRESVSFTILQKGIKEDIFRGDLNLVIVDIFIHNMMETCHSAEIFPVESDLRDIIANVIIPYFRGIATRKGQDLIEKYFSGNS